jgi:hypothetical protein
VGRGHGLLNFMGRAGAQERRKALQVACPRWSDGVRAQHCWRCCCSAKCCTVQLAAPMNIFVWRSPCTEAPWLQPISTGGAVRGTSPELRPGQGNTAPPAQAGQRVGSTCGAHCATGASRHRRTMVAQTIAVLMITTQQLGVSRPCAAPAGRQLPRSCLQACGRPN